MVIVYKRRPGKNIKTRRALKKYDSKVFENPKKVLMLKGQKTSEEVLEVQNDLSLTLQPNVKKLQKKNAFLPFEGRHHIEFLGFKNDCSLFCFVSHNKKREHNIVLGRMFDFHVLDMFEFGVVGKDRLDLSDLRKMGANSASLGGKPCFVFQGSEFNADPFFIRLKNFIVDFFKGIAASTAEVVLTGVDRAVFISLRSTNGSPVQAPDMTTHGAHKPVNQGNSIVCFRQYAIVRPGNNPNIKTANKLDLVDIGPNLDLVVRRCSCADDHQFKQACFIPKEALATLRSMHAGVSHDSIGNLRGQLHVGAQDVAKGLALRKFKAHKRSNRAGEEEEEDGEGGRRAPGEVEYDASGQAVRSEVELARNKGRKHDTVVAGPKKQRKVEADALFDERAAPASLIAGGKKRHRVGQGKQATNDALSFVDM